jgi:hypothetical protein
VKVVWGFGGTALGVTPDEWRESMANSDVSTLAVWGTLTLTGITPTAPDSGPFTPTGLAWMILFGGAAFATLGTALAIGARSYQHRSQPTCAL